MRCLAACLSVVVLGCTTADEKPEKKKNPLPPTAEERFPDYRPKTSPDTVLDYRPQISSQLEKIPAATLDNLSRLIGLLEEYKRKSRQNPGKEEEGNVILGADPREYVPSDEELLQGEIGDRIRKIVETAPADKLQQAKPTAGQVDYGAISYRHVDVMGSGRFFYASRPTRTIISFEK